MQPKNHGATLTRNNLLVSNWHEELNDHQLAQYVRYQYIRLREGVVNWESDVHTRRRNKWDGGKDAYGVKYSAVWPKVVKEIRTKSAHPGVWVCAHFSPWAIKRLSLTPSKAPDLRPVNLARTSSYDIYREYCDNIQEHLNNEFDMAGVTMARRYKVIGDFGLSEADKALYIVCDESYVTATPFFRHAFAAKFGAQKGVEKYLWLAAADYEPKQQFYDVAVADWCVTAQLKEAVLEIRQQWTE
jgi:hypothetical protein